MKKFFLTVFICMLLSSTLWAIEGIALPHEKYSNTNILVKPYSEVINIDAFFSGLGLRSVEYFPRINVHKVEVLNGSVEEMVEQLNTLEIIDYAELDYVVNILQAPDDPDFELLWGLHNTGQTGGTNDADIDALEAWDITTGGDSLTSNSVLVAVNDTGVNYNHTDLASNMWVNSAEIPSDGIDNDNNGYIDDVHGWDFYNSDNNPMDDHSHGTHCSGIIGADGNNGIGVVGVNWTVSIMPVKFLSSGGGGYTSGAISAIDYSTTMGAEISSNSWGGGSYTQALYDAIKAFGDAGGLFVAAAGNSASNNDVSLNPMYPASYDLPNIISVAATDHNDNKASFSSYGPTTVDVAAPGVSIYSTLINGYGSKNGTSMATPHVAGIAALVKSINSDYGYAQIKQAILDSVDVLIPLVGKILTDGRVNAYKAIGDNIIPNTVSFSKKRFTGSEKRGKATIKARCDGTCNNVSIDIISINSTAKADYDFNCGGTLYFSNSSEENLVCEIIDDNIFEPTEKFWIILDNPINAKLGYLWISNVQINDNDGDGGATLTINVPVTDSKTSIKLMPKQAGKSIVWSGEHCEVLQDEQETGNILIKPLDGPINCTLSFE